MQVKSSAPARGMAEGAGDLVSGIPLFAAEAWETALVLPIAKH